MSLKLIIMFICLGLRQRAQVIPQLNSSTLSLCVNILILICAFKGYGVYDRMVMSAGVKYNGKKATYPLISICNWYCTKYIIRSIFIDLAP